MPWPFSPFGMPRGMKLFIDAECTHLMSCIITHDVKMAISNEKQIYLTELLQVYYKSVVNSHCELSSVFWILEEDGIPSTGLILAITNANEFMKSDWID